MKRNEAWEDLLTQAEQIDLNQCLFEAQTTVAI